MQRRKFIIASVYDTETTNYLPEGATNIKQTRSFPILFIDNDIRDIGLYNYEPDRDDNVHFYRYEYEMQNRIDEYIDWGCFCKKVPIICAYNLMFDLHPLMEDLNARYDIRANAQSSTNVYTLDLYEKETDNLLLRFWDTFHLEMRGLSAMGETSGLPKAIGDWDYTLVRTPETQLTEQELYYAARDTQVIPYYLRYLLRANEFIKQDDFGCKVLTKTSIVRQMAKRTIGRRKIDLQNGKKISLEKSMLALCKKEAPKTYGQYGIRKASFRGGYTFTAAKTSMQVVKNVVSVDVTSMHHTFINGRRIPENFEILKPSRLTVMCENVLGTSRDYVLSSYDKPFDCAFHIRMRITNIRLKKNTVFESAGIGLLAESKFLSKAANFGEYEDGETYILSEQELKANKWHDVKSDDAIFGFGKLYYASDIIVHVNEVELWAMSRVYEWDSYTVICGEGTWNFRIPPDFVTLQSNMLYEQKDKAKRILEEYKEGEGYKGNLEGIPDGISNELREGSCKRSFLSSWYGGTVKGMFNGIYGTMAQDILKPTYKCEDGQLIVDIETLTTPDNFDEKSKRKNMVLYTYGMRIVGGSRLHMVIAMELIYERFGSRCDILGGDTDSMKIRCDFDVTNDDINNALYPMLEASTKAIEKTMQRLRNTFPDIASSLRGIGGFEIENANSHYSYHMECWNKCRISFDTKAHVTCAGLSRPSNKFNVEDLITRMVLKYGAKKALPSCIGFNTFVAPQISYSLESHKPNVSDRVNAKIVDYEGKSAFVSAHESESLYSSGRWLGETLKITNIECVRLLKSYGIEPITETRYMQFNGKEAYIEDSVGNMILYTTIEGG